MNTNTATEYRNLPLAVLTESATNPRRIFEDFALKELPAASAGLTGSLHIRTPACHAGRPRVRVPSSPPHIPKGLSVYGDHPHRCRKVQPSRESMDFCVYALVFMSLAVGAAIVPDSVGKRRCTTAFCASRLAGVTA
jgi:hypothetical protein